MLYDPLSPSPSALPTQALIGPCMGMHKSRAWAGVGNGETPAAGRRMKHGPSSGGGLPEFCPCRTTCAMLGQAQALIMFFTCPRSCLGMHNWGPIGPTQSFAWASSSCGKPNQLLGHAQSGTPKQEGVQAQVLGLGQVQVPLPNQLWH